MYIGVYKLIEWSQISPIPPIPPQTNEYPIKMLDLLNINQPDNNYYAVINLKDDKQKVN